MLKHLHDFLQNCADSILSYLAAAVGLVGAAPWMNIGGAVLLAARLIIDVPPAYNFLKQWIQKHRADKIKKA